MLYALDLFSGIGGNSLALRGYAETIAYCEADEHARAVLISRMAEGSLQRAPICTDVSELDGHYFRGIVDIIIAGFPCQDISCAGKGAGLEGQRSGLFFQIVRLAKEIQPTFLFLENVPAIRTRGLDRIIQEFTALGYDIRWTMLSASEVGAPHKRERWFCVAAHSSRVVLWNEQGRGSGQSRKGKAEPRNNGPQRTLADSSSRRRLQSEQWKMEFPRGTKVKRGGQALANSEGERRGKGWTESERIQGRLEPSGCSETEYPAFWATEPDVGRVVDGLPYRVDRIKRLGNAVVPAQAKAAFEMLMGVNNGVSV